MVVTDGSRLYFEEAVAGGWGIVQVSAVGGETVPISTPFPNAGLLGISADHSDLLVHNIVANEQDSQLWAVPVLGGTPRRLGDVRAHDANWSPDGRKLIYANGNNLYLANADGTESRRLLELDTYALWTRFSPDGQSISFSMLVNKASPSYLWEVSNDGGYLHRLLARWNFRGTTAYGNWTADGKYFVFEAGFGGKHNIWAVRERTGLFGRFGNEPTQLTTGPLDFYMPLSSLDGKRLFVIGVQQRGELLRYDTSSHNYPAQKEPALLRLRLSDHKVEHVLSLKNIRRAAGYPTVWSGIDPDGSPLIVRDVGSQEIYALDVEFP
jgi:dipeptidyl aminopeptidase/acylaminoacyl peptidase